MHRSSRLDCDAIAGSPMGGPRGRSCVIEGDCALCAGPPSNTQDMIYVSLCGHGEVEVGVEADAEVEAEVKGSSEVSGQPGSLASSGASRQLGIQSARLAGSLASKPCRDHFANRQVAWPPS